MSIPWLITRLGVVEYMLDGDSCRLAAETSNGQALVFWGSAGQSINLVTLAAQRLPIAVLCDNCRYDSQGVAQIEKESMVAVVPIAARALQQLLDEGRAGEFLAQVSGR